MEGVRMISLGVTALQVQANFSALAIVCSIGLVWLIIGVIVYRDAESRGMSGIGWFFVVLIGGIIGIIVYLVVREDRRLPHAPPAPWAYAPSPYHRPFPPASPYVPPEKPPGTAPQPTGPSAVGRSCPSCESNIPFDAIFCPNCGNPVT